MADLSDRVRRFLATVKTIEEIELLVFLARRPTETFTVGQLSSQLGIEPRRLERQLAALDRRKLINLGAGNQGRCSYAPASAEDAASLAAVLTAYGEQRTEVIHFVATRSLSELNAFAAAFRVRKDKD